ncbi:hypothetical protein ISN44_As05g025860, partial [Arabidopsis suecica]
CRCKLQTKNTDSSLSSCHVNVQLQVPHFNHWSHSFLSL